MTTSEDIHAKRERSKYAFRFLDEETGEYWTGKLQDRDGSGSPTAKFFNHLGVEYRDERASDSAWVSYEALRQIKPHLNLPELVRMRYEVVYHEVGKETFQPKDKAMVEALFARACGYNSHASIFIRQLLHRQDWSDFLYVIVRDKGGTKGMEFTETLNAPLVSSRKTKSKIIAVRSDADLLVAKMNLGVDFKCAYELRSATLLQ